MLMLTLIFIALCDLILIHATVVRHYFNTTLTTIIYTLSLHDALPISSDPEKFSACGIVDEDDSVLPIEDRKSTRLNSSHTVNSYAVFCLKKKNRRDNH